MDSELPPELSEKIREIIEYTCDESICDSDKWSWKLAVKSCNAALIKIYPLIVSHVAKRAAGICRKKYARATDHGAYIYFEHEGNTACAEAIERELIGGKYEQSGG